MENLIEECRRREEISRHTDQGPPGENTLFLRSVRMRLEQLEEITEEDPVAVPARAQPLPTWVGVSIVLALGAIVFSVVMPYVLMVAL